jgi:hypothetical protein
MTFVWMGVSIVVIALDVLTIVDVLRRSFSAGKKAAWIALVVIFPFLGALAYWIMRKPEAGDVEAAYRAEADFRRTQPPV